MDHRPASRRVALTRALRLGAAAAFAATVGDVGAARLDAAARPATSRAAANLETPALVRPEARAATTPEVPRAVRLTIVPTGLAIPALGIDAPIAPAELSDGGHEIVVPESGLVSPNRLLGDDAINRIWVLGHSRGHLVPQLLYTVGDLEAGDHIEVAGSDLATGRPLPTLTFEVERLVVADVETTGKYVYGPPPDAPQLVIQTSARQAWDPAWILDRERLLAKAELDLAGDIDDLARYLLLLVTARLQPEALASILAMG